MVMIDLAATTTQALKLLSSQGMSEKSLYAYTHTGFGCVTRHFQSKGIICVSPEMLDTFLLEQRELFGRGAFSVWKWRLLRRSCELLKHCAAKNSVELPPLSPWMPVLRRPRQSIWKSTPTSEQFADSENIFALVWKTNRAMLELGLTDATVEHYRNEGLAIILNRHYEVGTEQFSEDILKQVVAEKRIQYEHGQVGRVSYQNLRKAAYLVQEMHQTGNITLERLPDWGRRELTPQYKVILNEFRTHVTMQSSWAESSISAVTSVAHVFLLELEDQGITSIETAAIIDIVTCTTKMLGRYSGGMKPALFGIRTFLRFLYEAESTPDNLCKALPEFVCPRKNFHEGFTGDELESLLAQPDTTSAVGKRDYAMMVLAVQSGLRSCDIIRLTFDNINWRTREIRVVQHKTGQPLTIPLEPETGNAIADYLLNDRPQSSLPQIFLCHTGTVRALKSRSGSAIVSRYMKRAGILSEHCGFHSFRRTFATNLLQNEVSFELIQQLLGHRNMDSMKQYLSIDEQGLKQCALPLLTHGKVGN